MFSNQARLFLGQPELTLEHAGVLVHGRWPRRNNGQQAAIGALVNCGALFLKQQHKDPAGPAGPGRAISGELSQAQVTPQVGPNSELQRGVYCGNPQSGQPALRARYKQELAIC